MLWVLDHLADIESDLSAIHRVDDMAALDGPRFFRLAYRLGAYRGVMRMRAEEIAYAEHSPARAQGAPGGGAERMSAEELRYSGRDGGLVQWG